MNLLALVLVMSLVPAPADTAYVHRTPARDGTGKIYMGREIAIPMGHRGAT